MRRSNVAITNNRAGIGRGKYGNANSGNYGFHFCQPVYLKSVIFGHDVPLQARLQFARGEANNYEYGFRECIVYDEDGSLNGAAATPEEPRLYISSAKHIFPEIYQTDCTTVLEDPKWYESQKMIYLYTIVALLGCAKCPICSLLQQMKAGKRNLGSKTVSVDEDRPDRKKTMWVRAHR